jgi:hypothetical protein
LLKMGVSSFLKFLMGKENRVMRKNIFWGFLSLLIISTNVFAVTGGQGVGNIAGSEPNIMLLLGVGLICLAGLGRRIIKQLST